MLTALERPRSAAFPVEEYVGQESFMRAAEVRRLARRARVGSGVSVLELCRGVAGPGRMITAESGCHYMGVDQSASALATAQQLAVNLPCRFEQAHLPPLPEGRFEVVFLLEIGTQATAELITAHELWSGWLGSGQVRQFAMVAEKQ